MKVALNTITLIYILIYYIYSGTSLPVTQTTCFHRDLDVNMWVIHISFSFNLILIHLIFVYFEAESFPHYYFISIWIMIFVPKSSLYHKIFSDLINMCSSNFKGVTFFEFNLWSSYNSLYPALVLFEWQNCIDRINVCFIQSLTEYHFLLLCHYVKPWNDVKLCNVFNLIEMVNVTHLGSHNHI